MIPLKPKNHHMTSHFFQEDGLEGTFVIDLGDIEIVASSANEITDPKELEELDKQTDAP
jgi:hypothetical protein